MTEPSTPNLEYDFCFVLEQASTLKNAIAALSDTRFNNQQMGLIQVGQGGFEITVHVIDSITQKPVFGFLYFKATGLFGFECDIPCKKTVSLLSIFRVLQGFNPQNDEDDSMGIFSNRGSDKLSFQWSNENDNENHDVELHDINPENGTFPDVFCGFRAVIPTKTLMNTITELIKIEPESRPSEVIMTLKGATVEIELDDDIILNTEKEQEEHEVSMEWQYWESLEKASILADKCTMYLVTDPPEHIMFRFSLGELGDLVYLTPAKFITVSELPFLDHFHWLLNIKV